MTDENVASKWLVRPSLWFDALCLIPLLAQLPFYTQRHEADANLWHDRFGSIADRDAIDGLRTLRVKVWEEAGKPLPAFLSLWTSPAANGLDSPEDSFGRLVTAVSDPEGLSQSMRRLSRHWREEDDSLFREICPALSEVLAGLQLAGLTEWWCSHIQRSLERRCEELQRSLSGYDLIPLVAHHTKVPFDSDLLELNVLRWAAPHGIRVVGTRFLADVRYDADVVLNIAIHELLHPPWPEGHPIQALMGTLSADPFLSQRFADRDPVAGYNTWEEYAEEDAAQALDQFLADELGHNTRGDPKSRWSTSDGGMHVLALLLHDLLCRAGYGQDDVSYGDFLLRGLADHGLWHDLQQHWFELTRGSNGGA